VRRRLRWGDEPPTDPPSAHPYRDTAFVYAGFAVLIVVVAVATGGGLVRAVLIAALFWLAATSYGVLGARRRRRERDRRGVR
jgi:hypothetical protein